MVMFRRLDPLANASPHQRLLKSPLKSFTLTSAQYDRLSEQRPQLIVNEGEAAVIGLPVRDFLEIHYAFPDVEGFRDRFAELFTRVVTASSKEEAPRGVLLAFRDRPNRAAADPVFWSLAMDKGREWVEMNHFAIPEQPEPAEDIEGGFKVREANEKDGATIADIEAEATGQPRLTDAGLKSLFDNARWVYIVEGKEGPAGYLALTTEPGGWGIIQQLALPPAQPTLQKPLLDWAIGFLRNHGGRRVRRLVYLDDSATLSMLREAGFMAGETGLDFTRAVDAVEIQSKLDERQSHGTLIKFGDWR